MIKKAIAVIAGLLFASAVLAADQFYVKNTYVNSVNAATNSATLASVTNAVGVRVDITFNNTNTVSGINVYEGTNASTASLIAVVGPASQFTPPHSYPDISGLDYFTKSTTNNTTTNAVIVLEHYGSSAGLMPR